VAVREGNDILAVQGCVDGTIYLMRIMQDRNTPEGKADITAQDNTYTVCFLF